MAPSLEDGKHYLNLIYQKLQIAIAVAVIRSRPENTSTEEYIASLKDSLIQRQPFFEHENSLPDEGNCHIGDISQQQEELFNKLWSVVPNDSDVNSTEELIEGNKEIDTSQDLFLSECLCKNNEVVESDDEEADANVRFIEAIVQLKFIINSRSTIPANKFKDVLELFLSPEEFDQNNSVVMRNKKNWSNEFISCCALGYVMRSSETNKLLCLSFERVLEYLGQSVNGLEWDGDDENSLIAHAIKTIRQLIDLASAGSDNLAYCLNVCLKFVTNLVDQLKNGKDMNKASIWERHCTLILELCKERYLGEKMISYIIETILKISKDFQNGLEQGENKSNGCGCGPSFEPHSLENSWYMLYMLKKLIVLKNEADQLSGSPIPTNESGGAECGEICQIRDLWRLNWKGSDSHEGAGNSLRRFYAEQHSLKSSVVTEWKEQLTHYIKVLSFHYPLFTYELYECEKLL